MINFEKFDKWRREFGQKKYGAGKDNAGWRRDNGRDVLEELHDGVVIAEFWEARLLEVGNPLHTEVRDIIVSLNALMGRVLSLREKTPASIKNEVDIRRAPPTSEVE